MANVGRGLRSLGGWLLAASTLSGGCLSFCHPTGEPSREQIAACNSVPPCCRNHVYVFFVNGIDPLACANLCGVRSYVQSLGFIKAYYGQFYHAGAFAKEIRRLHHDDPNARFVLVGYSYGANKVEELSHALRPDGIVVDLIVCLGDASARKTDNVGRVIHVQATGWGESGSCPNDGYHVTCADVSAFGSAAHQNTLEMLAHELTMVAALVPIDDPHAPVLPEPIPVPRPAMPPASAAMDEWDFLKLRPPSAELPTAAPAKQEPKEPAPLPSSVGKI